MFDFDRLLCVTVLICMSHYSLISRAGTIRSVAVSIRIRYRPTDTIRFRYDKRVHDLRFQQQSECFRLIYTVH